MTADPQLPNLIMIGVAKAGTTSLFDYLGQHPHICASDEKELFYFSPLRYGESLAPVSEYVSHFSHCGLHPYRMEASPGYYFGGAPIIEAMHETLGAPRVLLILREPVARLWSYYNFERSRGNIDRAMPFQEYVAHSRELRSKNLDGLRENNAYWGLSSGLYGDPLASWLTAFGDRMLVVFFEHLAKDPRRVVTSICEWAGIDPAPAETFDYAIANKTVQPRSARLQQAAAEMRVRNEQWLGRHPGIRRAIQSAYRAVNGRATHEVMTDAAHRELRETYAASNRAVREELQARGYVDLPEWLFEGSDVTGTGSPAAPSGRT